MLGGQLGHNPQFSNCIYLIYQLYFIVFHQLHLHLVVAQPVGVLHVVDSVTVVIKIVDVRDPVVVVVLVNCKLRKGHMSVIFLQLN